MYILSSKDYFVPFTHGMLWNLKHMNLKLNLIQIPFHFIVDGSWGAWSEWSGWARGLCSGNQRVKTRPCTNPVPSSDGKYCVGDNAINEPGSGMICTLVQNILIFNCLRWSEAKVFIKANK